jgi:hypothetical protein
LEIRDRIGRDMKIDLKEVRFGDDSWVQAVQI